MTTSGAGLSDPKSLVLLAARLRSRGTIDDILLTISMLSGRDPLADSGPFGDRDPHHFRSVVIEMIDGGMIRSRGDLGRLSLTLVGAERLRSAMADSTARVGRDNVEDAYQEFIDVNREFLSAVSTWQSGPASGVELFSDLVGRIIPAVMSLSLVLPRFSCYPPRFDSALNNAADRREWIESPLIDSVHTIWFELHEHFLASLGLVRSDER